MRKSIASLLSIFLLLSCNESKRNNNVLKDPGIVFELVSMQGDPECTNPTYGTALSLGNTVTVHSGELINFRITKDPLQSVKSTITLLSDNCSVDREYLYCPGGIGFFSHAASDTYQADQPNNRFVNCDSVYDASDWILQGNTGYTEACTINYDTGFFFIELKKVTCDIQLGVQ